MISAQLVAVTVRALIVVATAPMVMRNAFAATALASAQSATE